MKRSRTTWIIKPFRCFAIVHTSVLIIGYTVLLQCDVAESETIQLRIYPCTRHMGNARVYRDNLVL